MDRLQCQVIHIGRWWSCCATTLVDHTKNTSSAQHRDTGTFSTATRSRCREPMACLVQAHLQLKAHERACYFTSSFQLSLSALLAPLFRSNSYWRAIVVSLSHAWVIHLCIYCCNYFYKIMCKRCKLHISFYQSSYISGGELWTCLVKCHTLGSYLNTVVFKRRANSDQLVYIIYIYSSHFNSCIDCCVCTCNARLSRFSLVCDIYCSFVLAQVPVCSRHYTHK